MAAPTGPTHDEMRDRLLQQGSAELREEYTRLGPRHDAVAALFRARNLRKLTQHELAQRAGVSQGVISRLERGGHSPKLETLERIARAMDFRLELTLVDEGERGAAASAAASPPRGAEAAPETVHAPSGGRHSMWVATQPLSAHQLRNETAAALGGLGYEVSVKEELDLLPGYRADLVARKGDEVRLVEVMTSTVMLDAGALVQLLRAIEERPGWSFDLLLAAETEQTEPPRRADLVNPEHVRRRLDEAEQALDAGRHETAFLLACLALEAKLMLLGDRNRWEERFSESHLESEQAAAWGVISAGDREQLARLWDLRNAVLEGYHALEFDEASVRAVISVVRGLGAAAV